MSGGNSLKDMQHSNFTEMCRKKCAEVSEISPKKVISKHECGDTIHGETF